MSLSLSANAPENITPAHTTEASTRGLSALLIGGAIFIIAMWWAVMQLSTTLARIHVDQRMGDVAAKAERVLRESHGLTPQTMLALSHLARFRDIARMELRDANGALLWRNYQTVSRVRHTPPASGQTLLEKRNIDGMLRDWARHHALLSVGEKRLHLLLEADMTPILASYQRVALLVAKAFTTVQLAAILLMGWLLMRRQRLEVQRGAGEDWREEVETLQAGNARLLRRVAHIAASGRTEADDGESAANKTEKRRHA